MRARGFGEGEMEGLGLGLGCEGCSSGFGGENAVGCCGCF